MACTVFTVDVPGMGKLGTMTRPRGGDWLESEIESLSLQGFDNVVSLLEDAEIQELGLAQEGEVCRTGGLKFLHLPIPDLGVPNLSRDVLATLSSLHEDWAQGRSIVIHCRMAYGRAPMVAAALMVSHGYDSNEAVELLSAARGIPVPETDDQRAWLREFERLAKASRNNQ